MTEPTSAIAALRELVDVLDDDDADHQALATGALASLSAPTAAVAALVEVDELARLDQAEPHLVSLPDNIVEEVEIVDVFDEARARAAGVTEVAGYIESPTELPIPFWQIPMTTRRVEVHDCPDCSRGVNSIDGVLVCVQLPRRVGTLGGNPGDIVACGRSR